MTHTLPTLALRKTKNLFFLNVSCFSSTFSTSSTQYHVKKVLGSFAAKQLLQLQCIAKMEDVPYAVIADYKILAANNFAFVKIFRTNIFTQNVPLIAIADENDIIDAQVLAYGIDDCYLQPVDFQDICSRIEFLHSHRDDILDLKDDSPLEEKYSLTIAPFKRIMDILIAALCIVVLSPVLLFTALLIRLESKGAVIYRSKRSGRGYEVFDFFKFRSMYADSDTRLNEFQHLNQYSEENPPFVKVKNDPRITKVGQFIRKTSIDELPQLFNVLRGDMSIVGNRPLPLYEAECLTKEDWAYRFMAPAGITGLWQVSKRGKDNMSVEERINLDIAYAKKNSFWYDMKILLKTPFALIQKENV
jgi:lipopolysaccharide/colanic/teichoic acid biosynthesis glycosyltransferase